MNKRKALKLLAASVLSAAMVFTCIPASALAADTATSDAYAEADTAQGYVATDTSTEEAYDDSNETLTVKNEAQTDKAQKLADFYQTIKNTDDPSNPYPKGTFLYWDYILSNDIGYVESGANSAIKIIIHDNDYEYDDAAYYGEYEFLDEWGYFTFAYLGDIDSKYLYGGSEYGTDAAKEAVKASIMKTIDFNKLTTPYYDGQVVTEITVRSTGQERNYKPDSLSFSNISVDTTEDNTGYKIDITYDAITKPTVVVNYDYDDVPSIGWEFDINEGEEDLRGNMTLYVAEVEGSDTYESDLYKKAKAAIQAQNGNDVVFFARTYTMERNDGSEVKSFPGPFVIKEGISRYEGYYIFYDAISKAMSDGSKRVQAYLLNDDGTLTPFKTTNDSDEIDTVVTTFGTIIYAIEDVDPTPGTTFTNPNNGSSYEWKTRESDGAHSRAMAKQSTASK